MGFLDKLFGRQPQTTAVAKHTPAATKLPKQSVTLTMSVRSVGEMPDLVKLAGTTTTCKAAITELVRRYDPEDTGYLERDGVLQREPSNPVDPNAVAVLVEGERVGYLPGYLAKELDLSEAGARPVRVQIFTQLLQRGLRAEAWAWLGKGAPKWQHTEAKPPAMSPGAKKYELQSQRDKMVSDALAGGGQRAEEFRAGMIDGVHYLQMAEPIRELKREGRLEEALALAYKAIEAAEGEARFTKRTPAPAYTNEAAIILRKLGRTDEEVAVLKRYIAMLPPKQRENSAANERLTKLLAKTSK